MTADPIARHPALRPAEQGFAGRLSLLIQSSALGGRGEGILFLDARSVQPRDVLAMAGQGGICTVTINESLAMRLGLAPQHAPPPGDSPYYVSSVEARACEETGISAQERALTMRTLGASDVDRDQIATPGHVMVQVARNILRPDATLPEIANLFLSASTDTRFAAWSAILNADGDLAGAGECLDFAHEHGIAAYQADDVAAFGRARLKPWAEALDFSQRQFGN